MKGVQPSFQILVDALVFPDCRCGVPDTEQAAHQPRSEFVRHREEAVGDHEEDADDKNGFVAVLEKVHCATVAHLLRSTTSPRRQRSSPKKTAPDLEAVLGDAGATR